MNAGSNRKRRTRAPALLAALALLLSGTTDALGARACPHHAHAPHGTEAAEAAAETAGTAAGHRTATHYEAAHDAAHHASVHDAAAHEPHLSDSHSHPGDDGCDCGFHCVGGSAGPTPLEAGTRSSYALSAPEDRPARFHASEPDAAPRASLVPFVLPFANAPPAIS